MPFRVLQAASTRPRCKGQTRLILVRHAHSSANTGDSSAPLCGWSDVPLTARGWSQVFHLGQRFRESAPPAAVYSSSLRRAWNTADPLGPIEAGRVSRCPGLREISCGLLDGMPLTEVQLRFPDLWRANLRQDDMNFRWPGGESYLGFRRRCLTTVNGLAARHRGATIVLVTHAGVISQIMGYLHNANPAEWERFRPGNTGVTEIHWESRDVVVFDDRSHLPHELC